MDSEQSRGLATFVRHLNSNPAPASVARALVLGPLALFGARSGGILAHEDGVLRVVADHASDSELLAYAVETMKPKRHAAEIAAWSQWFEQYTPSPPDTRAFFNDVHRKNAPDRTDIATWFDWLELDDYVTFGGRP